MFKTFKIAADARRALAALEAAGIASDKATLSGKVNALLNRLAQCRNQRDRQLDAYNSLDAELRAANAKIDRMTSGLKRGSAKPTGA